MQATRSSDSQVIAVLKQVEAGRLAPELCRKHGISSATLYKWPSKFGGMDTIADGPECGMPKNLAPIENRANRAIN